MSIRTDLIKQQETGTKFTGCRFVGLLGLFIFSFLVLPAGMLIRKKLVAQDSIRELEDRLKEENRQDEFTFFDTLSDRKVNMRHYGRIYPSINDAQNQRLSQHQQLSQPSRDRKRPETGAHASQQQVDTTDRHLRSEAKGGGAAGGGYTIQVSALRMPDEARGIIHALKTKGYSAYLAKEDRDGQGPWYRVRVGRFSVRTEAERYLLELSEKAGLRGFVVPSSKNNQSL